MANCDSVVQCPILITTVLRTYFMANCETRLVQFLLQNVCCKLSGINRMELAFIFLRWFKLHTSAFK